MTSTEQHNSTEPTPVSRSEWQTPEVVELPTDATANQSGPGYDGVTGS